jgi:hypothetical protein
MTAQSFVVPLLRSSPVHIPRRDLVLAASDSLALRVQIMLSDNPTADPVTLTGGMGGSALRMVVWRDHPGHAWDYGAPQPQPGEIIWSGAGVIASDAEGAFDVTIPAMTMSGWPRRSGFLLAFDQDGGLASDVLAQGRLHLMPTTSGPVSTAEGITTDALQPITTD